MAAARAIILLWGHLGPPHSRSRSRALAAARAAILLIKHFSRSTRGSKNCTLATARAAAQPKQESCSGCSQGNKSASLALLKVYAQIQESRSGCSQGNNSASLALLQATRSSWPETLQSSAQFKTRSRPAQLKARSGLRPFAVQDSL